MNRYNDIPALPMDMLKDKYTYTNNVLYDPDQVLNFQMDALRYTGPEAPLYEEDQPRRNAGNQLLSIMENGSRYSHEPYHPEIFLGETAPDPRGITNDPDMQKLVEQNKFRMKYQEKRFKNDNDNSVPQGVISEAKMARYRKDGFYTIANRLNIFEESQDGVSYAANLPGSLPSRYEQQIVEGQKYVNGSSELVTPVSGSNLINTLSNMVGVNWMAQPDNKFAASSYSNLYRSKSRVNEDATKIFHEAEQDIKFGVEESTIVPQSIIYLIDQIKQNKKNKFDNTNEFKNDSATIKAGKNKVNKDNFNKGGKEIENIIQTYKKNKLENMVFNQPNLIPIKDGIASNRNQTNIEIKQSTLQTSLQNPSRALPKESFNQILYQVVKDVKANNKSIEHKNKYISPELLKKSMIKTRENIIDLTSRGNKTGYNNKTDLLYNKSSLHQNFDNISNKLNTSAKYTHESYDEKTNNNIASTLTTPDTGSNLSNFVFDTATLDNTYSVRHSGPIGRKYIVQEQDFEVRQEPVNNITTRN